jgi:hypothetical protein
MFVIALKGLLIDIPRSVAILTKKEIRELKGGKDVRGYRKGK